MDCICCIDLDTILPGYWVSRWKKIPRVYDAHELFCEMQEVVTRPFIYKIWKAVERHCVPHFRHGYTVNAPIAAEFRKMYGVEYGVIRNLPVLEPEPPVPQPGLSVSETDPPAPAAKAPPTPDPLTPPPASQRIILYQGAVNEGRCFETLIPAMTHVDASLLICGDGNYTPQAKALVEKFGLAEKVRFKGYVLPEELKKITRTAWCGITLFDRRGMSNYYSLANRFFDYMHAGIPQLAVNYPAYQEINNWRAIAVLIDEPGVRDIADALNGLLNNTDLYDTLVDNCKLARLRYNWQEEEKQLVRFYHQILG